VEVCGSFICDRMQVCEWGPLCCPSLFRALGASKLIKAIEALGGKAWRLWRVTCEEETVGQADLYSAQQRRDTGPVRRQVGQESSHQGGGCHWGLQHADERVSIDWLDDLPVMGPFSG